MSNMSELDTRRVVDRLDQIWLMGDRDECSIKHIWYALCSIVSGDRWYEGIDYNHPGLRYDLLYSVESDYEAQREAARERVLANITPLWEEIEAIASPDLEAFREALATTKFGEFNNRMDIHEMERNRNS